MITLKNQLFIEFDRITWTDVGGGIRRKVMAYGDELMAVYVEFQQGAVGTLHRHPHLQITYVESGRLTVHIGNESRVLCGGDFYFIPADVIHGVEAIELCVLIDFFTPMRADMVPAASLGTGLSGNHASH